MDDTIVPRFRRGDYAGGIEKGVKALMREFAGVRVGWNWPLLIGLALIVVGAVVAVDLFRHGKRGWGWVVAGLVFVVILVVVRILVEVLRSRGRASVGIGSVGGFGGGFGGGFSVGGGATGSW